MHVHFFRHDATAHLTDHSTVEDNFICTGKLKIRATHFIALFPTEVG